MNVGIDFDGVLCDTISGWKRFYASWAGVHKHPDIQLDATYRSPREVCPICYDVCVNSISVLPDCRPMDPMVRSSLLHLTMTPTMAQLGDLTWLQRRHRFYVVTDRDKFQVGAIWDWLIHYGIHEYFDGVVAGVVEKYPILHSLGCLIHVDDSPTVYQSLVGSEITPVLWDAHYNRDIDAPYRVTRTADLVGALGPTSPLCPAPTGG